MQGYVTIDDSLGRYESEREKFRKILLENELWRASVQKGQANQD